MLFGIFASSWDLNSTTEVKLSNELRARILSLRCCFVTDGREERTIEIDGVEGG